MLIKKTTHQEINWQQAKENLQIQPTKVIGTLWLRSKKSVKSVIMLAR